MSNYTFINPEFFYLLILPLVILVWYAFRHKTTSSAIVFSAADSISKNPTLKQRLRHLPYGLKIIATTLLIIALAI